MSPIEIATNVVMGYALAVAAQIVVFPWFGLYPSLVENLAIGAIFTGNSLVRDCALRRLFERWREAQGAWHVYSCRHLAKTDNSEYLCGAKFLP